MNVIAGRVSERSRCAHGRRYGNRSFCRQRLAIMWETTLAELAEDEQHPLCLNCWRAMEKREKWLATREEKRDDEAGTGASDPGSGGEGADPA